MKLSLVVGILLLSLTSNVQARFVFAANHQSFDLVNVFSDVDEFQIYVEIAGELEPGVYNNPDILRVYYQVVGNLTAGTPSGFSSFNLQRNISGIEFYGQGSSLSFEIAESANLIDGVQADELIDNGTILTFNAREINNGRFHPAIFELYFGGAGRIQNSNNIVSEQPFQQVEFGAEYINDLTFEADQVTLLFPFNESAPSPLPGNRSRGSGSIGELLLLIVSALLLVKLSRD